MGHWRWYAALIAPAVLGCTTEPNQFHSGCTGEQVRVTVGVGTSPVLSWSPACEVGIVAVRDYPPAPPGSPREVGLPVWEITASDQFGPNNLIRPQVRYGQAPATTTVVQAAIPLVPGNSYIVEVGVFDLNRNSRPVGSSGEFRP